MTTATATPTTDERIATRRATLQKQRAERKDELDLPRTMTTREVNTYLAETVKIDKEIAALNTAVETWAALPSLEPDERWLANLKTWRKTIDGELLAMHPRIRNKEELELQQRLTFSIRLIDFGLGAYTLPAPIISLSSTRVGELMRPDYETEGTGLHGPRGWRGSIKEVELRIKTITKQRADAQAALDVLLRTDDEKSKQAAEDAAFYATMKTMHCRNSTDGKSLVALTLDGDPLDVADMTEAQRAAFARFEAAHFGRPRTDVTGTVAV